MSNENYVEKKGAQALLATYLQLTRSAGLAQQLHQARQRAIVRRIEKASDSVEQLRLRQRLEAQTTQGETIDSALSRLQSRVTELSSFAEAGLSLQDFQELGLSGVVTKEDVSAAQARRRDAAAQRDAANQPPASDESGVTAE